MTSSPKPHDVMHLVAVRPGHDVAGSLCDFRRVGFGDDVIKQILEQNYRMLDELGVTYTKPAGF